MSVLLSSTLVLAAAAHDTTAQKPGSWIKSGGHYYWKLTAGSNLTNAFLDYDGETYYLASDGIMAKGWAKADGHWYYFHTWGMYKNIFFDYDGSTYYVDSSGIMATGWKKINGYWYYFHDGAGCIRIHFLIMMAKPIM